MGVFSLTLFVTIKEQINDEIYKDIILAIETLDVGSSVLKNISPIINDTTRQVRKNTGNNVLFVKDLLIGYDENVISLKEILTKFYIVIDPTSLNKQGEDEGTSYRCGIYYTDEKDVLTIQEITNLEQRKYDKPFVIEIEPLKNYYLAEDYHQKYLDKNPNGYCHIPLEEIRLFSPMRIDPGDYQKPATETIREKLTDEQFEQIAHKTAEQFLKL